METWLDPCDIVLLLLKPKTNHNEWRLAYFISFLLLVGFFVLNMFVGVVVENFHKCRESQEHEEKARREHRHAKKIQRKRKSERSVPICNDRSSILWCVGKISRNNARYRVGIFFRTERKVRNGRSSDFNRTVLV